MAQNILKPKSIENAKLKDAEYLLSDGEGLYLRVRPNGAKDWLFIYTWDKKRPKIALNGNDLTDIRKQADELRELVKKGINPKQKRADDEKAAERAAALAKSKHSVETLFLRWKEIELSKSRKDKGESIEAIFNRDVLPVLGKLSVDDVNKSQVMQVIDNQLARGTNRLPKLTLGLIRQMFRFAVDRDIIETDPTASIRKAKVGKPDVERERTLSNDEIKALVQQIPAAKLLKTTELAIWTAMSTCCRISELCMAQWVHIDFNAKKWSIPAENTKNGKAHTVYLSDFALNLFTKLKALSQSEKWVYPNTDDTNHVCEKSITKQLSDRQIQFTNRTKKLKNRLENNSLVLGTEKFTPHDLRRTGATMMGDLGVRPDVIEKCLNHTEENKVKRIYQRQALTAEQAAAWQLLGQRLSLLTSEQPYNLILGSFNKAA